MIGIRKYQTKDKENVRKILVETSRLPAETEKDIKLLQLLYNDYYIECEPEHCFVAVNDEDEAVGYIICAAQYKTFFKRFMKFYMPELKELGIKYYIQGFMDIAGHALYAKKYPAHLHINVLPVCQGKGTGTDLMNALKDELKKNGINGLMLSCAADNDGAIRFYKRNGFKVMSVLSGGCIMAINL